MNGRICIIGAGLSGVVLARELQEQGCEVELLEKSRGPGGRLSTRRQELYQFDHGAQFFTARSRDFREFISPQLASGHLAEWSPRLAGLGGKKPFKRSWFEPHYVAVPGMNAWVKGLAAGLRVHSEWTVASLERENAAWRVHSSSGQSRGPYDLVCSTAPAEQCSTLMPWLSAELEPVRMLPCYAWMLGFGQAQGVHWQAAEVVDSPIRWMSWGNSRPGRPQHPTLLVHSSNQWALDHFLESSEEVEARLSEALMALTAIDSRSAEVRSLHRWRYATTLRDLGRSFLFEPSLGLAACGDWCLQGRVEGAFLSARRLAEAISNLS
ncbi:FAD-dependent oxidoreductase [bacterium]|nr:FAD-dependent oxidoreductase [bacterium]